MKLPGNPQIGRIEVRRRELWYLLKFFLIFAAAEAMLFYLDFSALEGFIAQSAATWLALPSSGNLIFLKDGALEINSQCTGLVSSSVLGAIVFSLRKPGLKQKTAIFLAGFFLLLVLNYFRVFLVVWAGKAYGIGTGEIVHVASWFTTALLVIGLWYYFTKRITGTRDFSGFL